mmetsp:Transcript_29905/g.77437  ORF Transcript_29905/g.77437 Transcript_29905/m.77437 type:complete len:239 (+) Transcript_29905:332-1048(+)
MRQDRIPGPGLDPVCFTHSRLWNLVISISVLPSSIFHPLSTVRMHAICMPSAAQPPSPGTAIHPSLNLCTRTVTPLAWPEGGAPAYPVPNSSPDHVACCAPPSHAPVPAARPMPRAFARCGWRPCHTLRFSWLAADVNEVGRSGGGEERRESSLSLDVHLRGVHLKLVKHRRVVRRRRAARLHDAPVRCGSLCRRWREVADGEQAARLQESEGEVETCLPVSLAHQPVAQRHEVRARL